MRFYEAEVFTDTVLQGPYVSRPCTIYGRVLSDKTVEIQADVVITREGTLDVFHGTH